MPAKVLCMASPKGGTGKTVLTATFGAFLSTIGKRVLLIDVDAATQGLTLMYIKEVKEHNDTVFKENIIPKGILEEPGERENRELVKLDSGVDLFPSSYVLKINENIDTPDLKNTLLDTLALLKEKYDYIFLDAQAGSDDYARVAMSREVSDEVVIVTEYDPLSAAGVERLKGLMGDDLGYVRTWMLLNKMLPEYVESFSTFLEVAKYISPIPWIADVVRAYSRRKLALDLEYGNDFTLAIMQTLKSLLGDEISKDIDSWAEERAAILRQPIEIQYKDTEKKLKGLLRENDKRKKKHEKLLFVFMAIFLGLSILGKIITDIFALEIPEKDIALPLLGALLGSLIAIPVYRFSKSFTKSPYDEQISYLGKELRRLESLRKADLGAIIKSKEK